ncbi:hypothetical protein niasHT_032132 [Heterodera trifolii]|uniref:Uncharacterized protein n=1 Tax=Heterodera trifolii TaxID=157864 RepID=A0ABD2HR67_9BILA
MILLYFCFALFIANGFGEEHSAQWKNSCKEFGQSMQNLVNELANNDGKASIATTVETIRNLKTLSEQLAQTIQNAKHIKLGSLIVEHAHKISQFCQHLLIVYGRHNSEEIAIKERLENGIGQLMGRMGQIRRLIGTILLAWDIWPKLYNFRVGEGSSDAFAQFVDQMEQRVGQMVAQIGQNESYYQSTISSFDEALHNLRAIATEQNKDELRNYGKVWTIVQRLMITAWTEVLRNVTAELFGPSSKFYGLKLLTEFGKEIAFDEQICADAKAMFEQRKESIIDRIKNVATMLHSGRETCKTDSITKGQSSTKALKKLQNLYEIIYNELDMKDVPESMNSVKNKLAVLEQCAMAKDGMPNKEADDLALSGDTSNCMNSEGLEKGIVEEAEELVDSLNIC